MPQGLEIKDSSGTTILTISDRITRLLGSSAITGGTDSSVTNAGFTTGEPFWWVSKDAGGSFVLDPVITVTGDTMSWSWPDGGSGNYTVFYGVY